MLLRILFFIGVIIFTYSAFETIRNKGFWYFGHFINLSESYLSVGVIFLVLAVLSFWITIRMKQSKTLEEKYLKCLKCKDIFRSSELSSMNCPKCKGDLEDLEGFYERHPELKGERTGTINNK